MITSIVFFLISNACQQMNSSTPAEVTVLAGGRVNIYSTLQKLRYLQPTSISICDPITWKKMSLTVKHCKEAMQNTCWCFPSDVLYSEPFYKTLCKLLNRKIQLSKLLASETVNRERWACERKWRVQEESYLEASPLSSPPSNLHRPNRFVLNEARFCTDFLKSRSPAQCG